MKEFIEKLIGRLEESKKVLEEAAVKEMGTNGHTLDFENYNGGIGAVKCVITLVKHLADEWQKENDDTDYANIELYSFWKKHQWIPCSERLPENMQTVLFTSEDGRVDCGWYDAEKNWCVNDNYFPNAFRFIAWMPLPDPYKPEGE